jgi:hypothetical protein
MNYTSGRAFRQALEVRLREQSAHGATPLVRLRKLIAFDRFLARLAHSQEDAWALKGGLVLQFRFAEKSRLTKDMDLHFRHPLADALLALRQPGLADLGDWFAFEVAEAVAAPESTRAVVRRFPVHGLLDGRTFEDFHVDVGTGDPVVEPFDVLTLPPILAFAGIDPVTFPAYPLSQHVAEKLHAYARTHPAFQGSRVRDLVDLLLIAGGSRFEVATLRQAIHATYSARAVYPQPERLVEPPSSWRVPFRQLAAEVGLPWTDLREGHRAAAAFLDPVLQQVEVGTTWDPSLWTWATVTRARGLG